MVLAINTSTLRLSLALIRKSGAIAGELFLSTGKRHYGALFPSLDFLLNSVGIQLPDISCVAVAVGPGSFTGLRVGLATAKGLAHSLRIPIVGVSSLEGLAAQVFHPSLPITVLMESRRNDVFLAQFQWAQEGRLVKITEEQCLPYESLASHVKLPSLFIGSDYETQSHILKKTIDTGLVLASPHMWGPRASAVGLIGLRRYEAGQEDDPATLVPVYLRPPDIRPNPHFQGHVIKETRPVMDD